MFYCYFVSNGKKKKVAINFFFFFFLWLELISFISLEEYIVFFLLLFCTERWKVKIDLIVILFLPPRSIK
ncbi:hypothetical protein GDO81_003006 [Engystomops pustulosus]|uniref:Uncharacterized protein n=1 Tax=Engystomops pustulosus TaxID=76066 RepID=A0AAV6ZZK5_ENGPU|nr:hypothetical protein GDO81_003006 [Engystomops pustulosus]